MARTVSGHGPINIMKHLKGIHFPADKTTIVELAKNGPGPDTDEVVMVLEKIADKEYNSLPEITKEVGKIE